MCAYGMCNYVCIYGYWWQVGAVYIYRGEIWLNEIILVDNYWFYRYFEIKE